MSMNTSKFDDIERDVHAAFSGIKVNPDRLSAHVINRMHESSAHSKPRVKRGALLVAAILVALVLSTTAFAVGLGGFDRFVARFNPAHADIVAPVMAYAEDQGIRITVIGAQRFDNMAVVYMSVEDVSGEDRLGNDPHAGLWAVTECDNTVFATTRFMYFDEATNISYSERRIIADTTLSDPLILVSDFIFLAPVRYSHEHLHISLADVTDAPTVQIPGLYLSRWMWSPREQPAQTILLPGSFAQMPHPAEGYWISNIGISDGQFRLQTIQMHESPVHVRWHDVRFFLIRRDGEIISPVRIEHVATDENFTPVHAIRYLESYDQSPPYRINEFIFDVDTDKLSEYTLAFSGWFSNVISGNWQIAVYTEDTSDQIITIADDIRLSGSLIADFLTLTPLGLQMTGSYTDDNWWVSIPRGDGTHGVHGVYGGKIQVETPDGLILLRISNGSFGLERFELSWPTESPIDVSSVTAIIVNGNRIAVP